MYLKIAHLVQIDSLGAKQSQGLQRDFAKTHKQKNYG